jgi:nitrate/nitrite transport system substrate-binding protein
VIVLAKEVNRRKFLKMAGIAGAAVVAGGTGLYVFGNAAQGPIESEIPKEGPKSTPPPSSGRTIKIGFIPLTDCASVVMAKELGLYEKYGVKVEVSKEASWANIRDKIMTGDLNAAHCLFGMPFSVYTGVGGQAGKEMPIAMVLNNNGQAITLSNSLAAAGRDVSQVKGAVEKLVASGKEPTFAMTFPGGTHDIWLRYWLAATGLDQTKLKIITIPPPQMVANMKVGNMDGYSVGEPWNGVGVKEGIGFTHITSQEIWKHHPEKALVLNKAWSAQTEEVKAVMKAVLEASKWLDDLKNRAEAAKVISQQAYVNAPVNVIEGRLLGRYDLGAGLGEKEFRDDFMLFHRNGQTNLPRKAYGIWFMAQYQRFGYLKSAPEYRKIADTLIMQDLYREVAKEMRIAIPDDDMKPFAVDLDKVLFDPNNPTEYLKQYGVA